MKRLPEYPAEVREVLRRLNMSGHEAYVVGGCVRDMLRGMEPHDYDVASSAEPGEVKEIFSRLGTVDVGILHGTVGVKTESGSIVEVTAFRRDGTYSDFRRPDFVTFTKNIEDDLSRRDFTINSIAADIDGNTVDPFGGANDLKAHLIRCTGDAERRFSEDALRIMRALRFASTLDFEIEERTKEAIHEKKELLLKIAPERVFSELKKMLCGRGVFRVLTEFSDVVCTVIPELSPSVGFEHKSKYHIYDVYTHTAKAIEASPPQRGVRLALLFHDSGKPYCFTEECGVRHFKGHPEASEKIAETALRRLRCDSKTLNEVRFLCKMHDMTIVPEEKSVRRLMSKYTFEQIEKLCAVREADSEAHSPEFRGRGEEAREILKIAERIQSEKQCVSRGDMEVNGRDVMEFGFSGAEVGRVLQILLDKVISGEAENERESLLGLIEEIRDER